MHKADTLLQAPATEPITVAELRAHLRDVPDADGVLTQLIKDAREYVEEATGLALISQERRLVMDYWPLEKRGTDGLGWWDGVQEGALIGSAKRAVELPRAPLLSVDAVKTYDSANASSTFPDASYYVDTASKPGRLALTIGATWPVPTRPVAGVEIDYTAGWPDAASVPAPLKRAILLIAAHWYENRELVDYDGPSKVPMQAGRILRKYRIIKL